MMSELVMTHCPNCPKGRAFPNSLRWRKIDVGSDFTGKQGLIQAIECIARTAVARFPSLRF